MSRWEGKGMNRYESILQTARENGQVGVNKHMRQPTEPTSRLGFRGKRARKKDLKEIMPRLVKTAKRRPELLGAAVNIMRLVGDHRKVEQTPRAKATETPKAKAVEVVEAPTLTVEQLREKAKREALQKLADSLKPVEYAIKLSNVAG